jgi:dolichol-phosphate mannosyltransferase
VLEYVNGYTSAKSSFCDDVTLARHIAASGFKVGFMDGAKVLRVRMYEGAMETWKEWGRSLDLKDASSPTQTWGDVWLLASVQGIPILVVLAFVPLVLSLLQSSIPNFSDNFTPGLILLGLNIFLVIIRFGMLFAIAPSYDCSKAKGGWLFWLSPFADPLAVLRIILSAMKKPKKWRGRVY